MTGAEKFFQELSNDIKLNTAEKRKQEFLDRIIEEGLNADLLFSIYNFYGRDFDKTVEFVLSDKNSIDYSPNVYRINSLIIDKVTKELELYEEIKQKYRERALKIKTDSTLEGKWEDELLPEKEYNFTRNFDEYLEVFVNDLTAQENSKTYQQEPLPREELLEVIDKIKEYFIGFSKSTTFAYNHKPYMINATAFNSKEELVEYCSNLKNCVLFGVLKITNSNKFKLRYGQVEDENTNTQTESDN
jgi:hypothetical protein